MMPGERSATTGPVVTFSEQFAEHVRAGRARLRISQEELAFRAGIHRTQISLIEGGHRLPRLDTFVKLAGAMEVEPSELLGLIRWRPGVCEVGGFVVAEVEVVAR